MACALAVAWQTDAKIPGNFFKNDGVIAFGSLPTLPPPTSCHSCPSRSLERWGFFALSSMCLELPMAVIMIARDGRLLNGAVHSLDPVSSTGQTLSVGVWMFDV